MSITEYLESSPLHDIVKYDQGSQKTEAVPFCGTLRKHPYDSEKCLLIGDPLAEDGGIYEFRIPDILGVDDMPLPVSENGSALKVVRLWVHRGAIAIKYEPFEVGQTKPGSMPIHLHERVVKGASAGRS